MRFLISTRYHLPTTNSPPPFLPSLLTTFYFLLPGITLNTTIYDTIITYRLATLYLT
ncbi:hypothetical protein L873DRAFT_1798166 [Choiromyces venosus 120613-1]|uniref:Uncharacterized protein n=1 Tax=Choiromyces venosus 120613-1 TaxID=1336337 RepID=A0A3N4K3N2_9PEZI|nr:hypothetical protein L873DRAFT_1798166 [Choiromyces venosus 120613-1]